MKTEELLQQIYIEAQDAPSVWKRFPRGQYTLRVLSYCKGCRYLTTVEHLGVQDGMVVVTYREGEKRRSRVLPEYERLYLVPTELGIGEIELESGGPCTE